MLECHCACYMPADVPPRFVAIIPRTFPQSPKPPFPPLRLLRVALQQLLISIYKSRCLARYMVEDASHRHLRPNLNLLILRVLALYDFGAFVGYSALAWVWCMHSNGVLGLHDRTF